MSMCVVPITRTEKWSLGNAVTIQLRSVCAWATVILKDFVFYVANSGSIDAPEKVTRMLIHSVEYQLLKLGFVGWCVKFDFLRVLVVLTVQENTELLNGDVSTQIDDDVLWQRYESRSEPAAGWIGFEDVPNFTTMVILWCEIAYPCTSWFQAVVLHEVKFHFFMYSTRKKLGNARDPAVEKHDNDD